MQGRRHEIARLQSDIYSRSYHRLLWTLCFGLIILLLLMCIIVYMVIFQPAQNYYASTTEGKIIPLEVKR